MGGPSTVLFLFILLLFFCSQPSRNNTAQQLPQATPAQMSYRVKIINPAKKTDIVVRDMRKFNGRFSSVTEMKVKLMEEFGDQIPPTTSFSLGYFAGRQSIKYWIYTEEDLRAMYSTCTSQELMLWCDSRSASDVETPNSKRRKNWRR